MQFHGPVPPDGYVTKVVFTRKDPGPKDRPVNLVYEWDEHTPAQYTFQGYKVDWQVDVYTEPVPDSRMEKLRPVIDEFSRTFMSGEEFARKILDALEN